MGWFPIPYSITRVGAQSDLISFVYSRPTTSTNRQTNKQNYYVSSTITGCIHIYTLMKVRYIVSVGRIIQPSCSPVCQDASYTWRHRFNRTGCSWLRQGYSGAYQRVINTWFRTHLLLSARITFHHLLQNISVYVYSDVLMPTLVVKTESSCTTILRPYPPHPLISLQFRIEDTRRFTGTATNGLW